MNTRAGRWNVRLTPAAVHDFDDIVEWTADHFGPTQAGRYGDTVLNALRILRVGPSALGVRPRDDIAPGLMTLPLTRGGRKGRHLIVFRTAPDENHPTLDVLRILHESMDLPRHLSDDETA